MSRARCAVAALVAFALAGVPAAEGAGAPGAPAVAPSSARAPKPPKAAKPVKVEKPAKPQASPRRKPRPPRRPPPLAPIPPPTSAPVAGPPPAPPQIIDGKVAVRVIEIAGGRAYLEPGEAGGVVRGAIVTVRGKRFTVKSASAAHAVVEVAEGGLREGDRGEAEAAGAGAGPAAPRPAPVPLERFAGTWPEPQWPAAEQRPARVPLGAGRTGRVSLELVGQGLVLAPRSGTVAGHVALEARLAVEPWQDRPFGLDADAEALLWLNGTVGLVAGAQPDVRVRELRLRYGAAGDPLAAAGRLRWAARTVGLLDGLRVRSPVVAGGLTVAGFGGFVPNVVTGAPATDAARFGAEVAWDGPHLHAGLVAQGSTFGGSLDERRLVASADVTPGPLVLDARAEIGLFDAGNPWGLSTLELLGAGAGAGLRAGPWRADLRFDLRQPERSRWLASLLPGGWTCPVTDCGGGAQRRLALTGGGGYEGERLAVTAGGTHLVGPDAATESSGFAEVRLLRLAGFARLGLGAAATAGSFLEQRTLRAEVGATLLRGGLDLGLSWRGSQLDFLAATKTLLEHRVALDAALTAGPRTDLVFTVEGSTGAEVDALVVLATAIWRPLP